MTAGWLRSQIRLGWLIPVHAGVYALGHVPRHGLARACAATLACGAQSAVSHSAAAAVWGPWPWPQTIEIIAPYERRRPGIRTHRSTTLTPTDIRVHQGIRVTSPVRTALDLQPRLSDPQLVRLVNDLRVAGHLRSGAFVALCARSRRVDRLLGGAGDVPERPTRSWLEDAFRRFTRRHGLPMAKINAILPHNGREVDALYPEQRLIIEVDSWRHHSSRASFERDRDRDADALAHGYRTLRITAERLTRGGAEEAARIRRILELA
ncbi:MAG TPA: hypothetical protein VKV21_06470 [Solirubrobacteraceae bacterium]|nr:hypothetical protein [Solirubrobacteraceae bacterium]